MISLSGSGAGWRWRRRLWVQRGVSGVIGHSRMWKARERRVHREQGPHTKGRAKGRELRREGGEWVSEAWRGDRGGEATLGTKADSTDTSHPQRVRLSLAPWGIYSLIYVELPAPHCWATAAPVSCSLRAEAAKTLRTQCSSDLWPTFNWYEACFFLVISALIRCQ